MDDSQAGNPHAIDPKTTGLRCRVRVGSADGVLAVVPHLLGFHPSDSLVMLGIGGPHARIRLGFRYDLPDPPDEELAADIAAHATTFRAPQHPTGAVSLAHCPGQNGCPRVGRVPPPFLECGLKPP